MIKVKENLKIWWIILQKWQVKFDKNIWNDKGNELQNESENQRQNYPHILS
jgi:hypothetical protein